MNKLKHLLVAMPGSYGSSGELFFHSYEKMEKLGEPVRHSLDGNTTLIITSPAPYALESSAILSKYVELAGDIEEIPCLWTGDGAPEECYNFFNNGNDMLMRIINEREEKADAIIMMTHHDVAEGFCNYFAKKLGIKGFIKTIGNAEALDFNLEQPSYRIIHH